MIALIANRQRHHAAGDTLEIHHFISIGPGPFDVTCTASFGGGDHAFSGGYELTYSAPLLDQCMFAALTEVSLKKDHDLTATMTTCVWDRDRWISSIDWLRKHHAEEAEAQERQVREFLRRLKPQPGTINAHPATRPSQ